MRSLSLRGVLERLCLAQFALAMLGASQAAALEPVAVTFAQLVRDPDRYAQKTVRIIGEVDNCVSLVCALCPAEAKAGTAQCMGLGFSGYSDDRAGRITATLVEEAFRFATVELEATFDPTCLLSYEASQKKKHPNIVMVCTDRASVLLDARVLRVFSRKSVLDGIVSGYDSGALVTPPDDERKAMLAEAESWRDPDASNPFTLFVIAGAPLRKSEQAWGLACICREASCDGRWPVRWVGGFDSPANPFACDLMIKANDHWRVAPK
ncbi:MAG TPA: hypothetical protein VGG48_16475 [Rhizomicrobium sp.]